jgi:hypothetical protein
VEPITHRSDWELQYQFCTTLLSLLDRVRKVTGCHLRLLVVGTHL